MKKILLTMMAVSFYCYCDNYELFALPEREGDFLNHFDDELNGEVFFDEIESLSLLEIDEEDEMLIPWSAEPFSSADEWADGIGGEEVDVPEIFEDVFAYDMPMYRGGKVCQPTHEKVKVQKERILQKPRVVESVQKHDR